MPQGARENDQLIVSRCDVDQVRLMVAALPHPRPAEQPELAPREPSRLSKEIVHKGSDPALSPWQDIVVGSEEAPVAIGAEFEIPDDHVTVKKPQMNERRRQYLLDLGLDPRLERADVTELHAVADLIIGDADFELRAVHQGRRELCPMLVDIGQKLPHGLRAQETADDDMRTAAFRAVENHRWQWLERPRDHAASYVIAQASGRRRVNRIGSFNPPRSKLMLKGLKAWPMPAK
jgi:hypothetical protein